jgi:hypothetical protein
VIDYAKLAIIGAILSIAFGSGWWMGNSRYVEYKKSIEIAAKMQEEKVKSIRSQQELVTKGIQNEYDAKLAAVRNYYKSTSVWNNPSSSKVSGLSPAPSIADVATAYNLLAGQCAETTAQTVALQSWIKDQIGIK